MVEPFVEHPQERDEWLAGVVSDNSRVSMKREPQTREHEVNHRRQGHVVELLLDAESPASVVKDSNNGAAVRERLRGQWYRKQHGSGCESMAVGEGLRGQQNRSFLASLL